MYVIPADVTGILDQPTPGGPLLMPAPSFTNETGTATSIPLVDQGAAALNGISQAQVNQFLHPSITPVTPAAPSGDAASDQVQKGKSTMGWIVGLGVVALVVAWLVMGGKRG